MDTPHSPVPKPFVQSLSGAIIAVIVAAMGYALWIAAVNFSRIGV